MSPSILVSLLSALLFLRNSHGMTVVPKTKSSAGTGFGASKTAWKTHVTDESASTKRLMQFLSSYKKGDVSNVEIGFSPNSRRGLYAVKQIGKGKIICKVPSDCALALADPNVLPNDAPSTPAHLGINFWNMYYNPPEARQQWSWYLDTLPPAPSSADTTPNFWSDDEIGLLELPRAVQLAQQTEADIQQLARDHGVSVQNLQYATWLVTTRSWSISLAADDNAGNANSEDTVERDDRGQVLVSASKDQRQFVPVLVPLLDMTNYNPQPNARWTILDPEKDDAWFVLEATRPIPPGKEITLAYGAGGAPCSSVELLVQYGFVPDVENKMDSLILQKGGDDLFRSPSDWSATVEEDKLMLGMLREDDHITRKILSFRIRMKKAHENDS